MVGKAENSGFLLFFLSVELPILPNEKFSAVHGIEKDLKQQFPILIILLKVQNPRCIFTY